MMTPDRPTPEPTSEPTAGALLRSAPLPGLEARILLAHALGWRRTELITRSEDPLDETVVARYRALQARRIEGEPIAQIIGVREFFGLPFEVTPAVLIPRPETELVVETALAAIESIAHPRVLDLGTGCGAIAVAIASARPDARVSAVDRSPEALAVAARNADQLLDCTRPGGGAIAIAIASARPDARVSAVDRSPEALAVAARNADQLLDCTRPGGPLQWLQGDWYAGLASSSSFDIIVSNPPYIAAGDPHLREGDLRFEPRGALTDEADGLSAIRAIVAGAGAFLAPAGQLWIEHIVAGAGAFLAPAGQLWIEHGYDQAPDVRAILTEAGFMGVHSLRDLAGIERASGGLRDAYSSDVERP